MPVCRREMGGVDPMRVSGLFYNFVTFFSCHELFFRATDWAPARQPDRNQIMTTQPKNRMDKGEKGKSKKAVRAFGNKKNKWPQDLALCLLLTATYLFFLSVYSFYCVIICVLLRATACIVQLRAAS